MNLANLEKCPKSTGKERLAKHLRGEELGRAGAMEAKCCECMCGYLDGREDCRIKDCPLYPWMPYREVKLDTDTIREMRHAGRGQHLRKMNEISFSGEGEGAGVSTEGEGA